VKEVNQAMAVRMKASKDLKRLADERNAAMQEYTLIMSERDTVHKEIEKLTDDLTQAAKKIKGLEVENKDFVDEVCSKIVQIQINCFICTYIQMLLKCYIFSKWSNLNYLF